MLMHGNTKIKFGNLLFTDKAANS